MKTLLENDTGRCDTVPSPRQTARCAVYCRKSTDEGLNQDFNSLDAQRESAEAYIASQRSEGWVCLPDRYDDGGYTGGNMERPALRRLTADIESGDVDCVVVYKVDRLSRSLLDFARIMELFDRKGVSFVSVTQQFNTTSSMGRLTLNILLSFAQFEREIIAERTRDKMSAARRKGKWVGGMPVLGYDVDVRGGRLVVNDEEAHRVRGIYELYLDHRSLMAVTKELNARGWHTKRWVTRNGRERGGKPFTRNSLFRLLTHVLYTGNIRYKGTLYAGEHDAIIDPELWQQVQDVLRKNGRTGGRDVRNKYGALLKGLLYCASCGTKMVHTYTVKSDKLYRYYVCLSAQQKGWASCPSKSLNAHDIETAVVSQIRDIGRHEAVVEATLAKVREESDTRLADLAVEERTLGKERTRVHTRLKSVVNGSVTGEGTTDLFADLQERLRTVEQRLTSVREERIMIEKNTIDEADLRNALAVFDPLWETLAPREQIRILALLIDRIMYDGRDGSVQIRFRSQGIRALCVRTGELSHA